MHHLCKSLFVHLSVCQSWMFHCMSLALYYIRDHEQMRIFSSLHLNGVRIEITAHLIQGINN